MKIPQNGKIINVQRLLFLLSFLTFGIGDGITSVYLMEKTGVIRESNPIIRFMYISSGGQGVIEIKIWFSFVILFLVWLTSRGKNMYWTVNGFLFALFLMGLMAMWANMIAASGMMPPPPSSIIITYLFLVIFLIFIGDLIDKMHDNDIKIRRNPDRRRASAP